MNRVEIVCYHTGEETKSYEVCRRIANRMGFRLKHVKDYELGTVPVVYGLFRGTENVIRLAKWSQLDYFYVDHGYTGYKLYEGNYRIVRNGMVHYPSNDSTIQHGWICAKFGVPGNKVILAKPSLEGSFFYPIYRLWPEEWVAGVKVMLKNKYGIHEENMIVSDKRKNPISAMNVEDIDFVVAHNSAIHYTSLIRGVQSMNWSSEGPHTNIVQGSERDVWLNAAWAGQSKLDELKERHFKLSEHLRCM